MITRSRVLNTIGDIMEVRKISSAKLAYFKGKPKPIPKAKYFEKVKDKVKKKTSKKKAKKG